MNKKIGDEEYIFRRISNAEFNDNELSIFFL